MHVVSVSTMQNPFIYSLPQKSTAVIEKLREILTERERDVLKIKIDERSLDS